MLLYLNNELHVNGYSVERISDSFNWICRTIKTKLLKCTPVTKTQLVINIPHLTDSNVLSLITIE